MYKFFKLEREEDGVHKWFIQFINMKTNKLKTIKFGGYGYDDYTSFPENIREQKKINYIKRHKKRENWEDPLSKGALSKWILWNKPSIIESLRDYLSYFRTKKLIL